MPTEQIKSALGDALGQVQQQWKSSLEEQKSLATVRESFDRLAGLGDGVSMEDMVEEMGKMVGGGIGPKNAAAFLGQAPQGGGPALAAWIAQNKQNLDQASAQFDIQQRVLRHRVGQVALHTVEAHTHPAGQPAAPALTPGGLPNA